MLFNSLPFALFLPIVFFLFWSIGRRDLLAQNAIILSASYFFYGYWDYRFLSLILFSTLIDFLVANSIAETSDERRRKLLLSISLVANLGLLGLFKYFNFFIDSLVEVSSSLGITLDWPTLNIILPVGISFYTFQTLSYTIDVYRRKIKPNKDFVQFACYVTFFPQLIAGPIEKARDLLPQFNRLKKFDYSLAVEGLRLMLIGFFKKMVIADNCALFVNKAFDSPADFSGPQLWYAAVLFSFQIYGDFSGYSDIAIGSARLFGFRLSRNFNLPYFSKDLNEFWKRWHISLSSWFKEYLYFPLGGNRFGETRTAVNLLMVFLVSGLWHGANWTFVVWGICHGLLVVISKMIHTPRSDSMKIVFIMATFFLTTLLWVIFRSDNFGKMTDYFTGLFSSSAPDNVDFISKRLMVIILVLVSLETYSYLKALSLNEAIKNLHVFWRYSFYVFITSLIILFSGKEQTFVYFQF